MKVKYNIRARQLVDVFNEIKTGRIILSPYFQRNYVWREVHKCDFIDTILNGLPFPEIFIAKGDINVETMQTTSCVVDGQQRLSTIREYLNNKFAVHNKFWDDLSTEEKEDFLKYEIAVIELDLNHDDPLIQDIFMRLNRTYYSLSNIEKLSSEYAHSDIMLLAKYLIGDLTITSEGESDEQPSKYSLHPHLEGESFEWLKDLKNDAIKKVIVESGVFSEYELTRQVHLMFTLNILGTIQTTIFNRNITKELLDKYSNEFPNKIEIVDRLEKVCGFILQLNFESGSYWYNKANIFSLILVLYNNGVYCDSNKIAEFRDNFENFIKKLPEDYRIAAKEGVNNRKERLIRNDYILEIFQGKYN